MGESGGTPENTQDMPPAGERRVGYWRIGRFRMVIIVTDDPHATLDALSARYYPLPIWLVALIPGGIERAVRHREAIARHRIPGRIEYRLTDRLLAYVRKKHGTNDSMAYHVRRKHGQVNLGLPLGANVRRKRGTTGKCPQKTWDTI
jgi:hypothetical protein